MLCAHPVTTPNSRNGSARTFRLGVFSRLVDQVAPGTIYARAFTLFETAERLGFEVAWVAQHHLHNDGGLPSPLVFLAAVAARTTRLRLATGIITLPLENPLRLAEDAAVLDILSGGRLELGFGTGGNAGVFSAFGHALDQRQQDYDRAFRVVREALSGQPLTPDGPPLFPTSPRLATSVWEAAMSLPSAARAGEHGSGLLLARTAMRAPADQSEPLGTVQGRFVETYLERYDSRLGPPRIGLSRSIYVAPTRAEALADAEAGMRRHAQIIAQRTGRSSDLPLEALIARADVHIGSPDDVIASLRADPLLARASDLILQVHPVDPPPDKALRSLHLIATEVAPALGWQPTHQAERTPAGARGGPL
jgi:putative FMN-dependent luciferase-like monooxygenase